MLQIQNASSTESVTQSIYVTAADVQTIAQASVYYLIELTSLGSLNTLYFLPSNVVANNGRYTKMTFTVLPSIATSSPNTGLIKFYDNTGKYDTYPMGFYTYSIYEQTSPFAVPDASTKLLESGMAYVRDYAGNMEEVTPDFNEYTPTTEQFIYP